MKRETKLLISGSIVSTVCWLIWYKNPWHIEAGQWVFDGAQNFLSSYLGAVGGLFGWEAIEKNKTKEMWSTGEIFAGFFVAILCLWAPLILSFILRRD